jgi:uncharacterized protein YwgA
MEGMIMSGDIESGLPRAIYPLLLLNFSKSGEIVGRTRLEKLVFLMQKKIIEQMRLSITLNSYQFRPYNFGPFDENVLDDLESLKLLTLIEGHGESAATETYRITEKGKAVINKLITNNKIPEIFVEEVKKLTQEYGEIPLDKLLRKIYTNYLEYTTNSVIRTRYL